MCLTARRRDVKLADLRGMLDRAVGAADGKSEEANEDKRVTVPNRADRRRFKRSHYQVVDNARPRSRTGAPDWFRSMKAKAAVKAALEKILTVHAYAGPHDGEPAAELEALSAGGFKTVWDLSQAKREDLLAVKGIGPVKLKKIRAELVRRSVPTAWKAE
jgi:hypothetical protein